MTKIQFKLSQIVLALVVAFGAITFIACGEGGSKVSKNASKAPKIMMQYNDISFVSQDDDTIIEGATVSGRNGKCKALTIRDDWGVFYDSMESCRRKSSECKPLFDGEKLFYNHKKTIRIDRHNECPPKNGVWYVKLDTNFGTFEYELSNR